MNGWTRAARLEGDGDIVPEIDGFAMAVKVLPPTYQMPQFVQGSCWLTSSSRLCDPVPHRIPHAFALMFDTTPSDPKTHYNVATATLNRLQQRTCSTS